MTQIRAREQIERFLGTKDPEVLSVSGRWGVGKTHLWDKTIAEKRTSIPLRRYAYVSVFGLRSLDALKTAIVQSTVPLDGDNLEPTITSFTNHLSSFSGIKRLSEQTARKGMSFFSKGAAAVPYIGKFADLLTSSAALLIREQIICIDDIERAGQGLDVADILGLASSLRERRRCKIVLLLNEDALGEAGDKYRVYIEKVVDQAVKFEPSPKESAEAAIADEDELGQQLAKQTVALGIQNIRVIRRIRRFLGHIEHDLIAMDDGVVERVIHSIALLGWCVFEPTLAPDLERVRDYAQFGGIFSDEKSSAEELKVGRLLDAYGFGDFDEMDQVLLAGLQAGAFDHHALRKLFHEAMAALADQEDREKIAKPWSIFRDGLGDDRDQLLQAITVSFEQCGGAMSPSEASNALRLLRELGSSNEADRLLRIYLNAQRDKPRNFFTAHIREKESLDSEIVDAFRVILDHMPLDWDPDKVLLGIANSQSWNNEKLAFLATVPPAGYDKMLNDLRGEDLYASIRIALSIGENNPNGSNEIELSRRMKEALHRAASRSALNRLRLRRYVT